jgi:isoquinoline 1-oxidoreductase alpha subunit
MAAVDFLKRNPAPTDEDIRTGITNLCRCGTYLRIRKAIRRAAAKMAEGAA